MIFVFIADALECLCGNTQQIWVWTFIYIHSLCKLAVKAQLCRLANVQVLHQLENEYKIPKSHVLAHKLLYSSEDTQNASNVHHNKCFLQNSMSSVLAVLFQIIGR